jgi:hypothetical protein
MSCLTITPIVVCRPVRQTMTSTSSSGLPGFRTWSQSQSWLQQAGFHQSYHMLNTSRRLQDNSATSRGDECCCSSAGQHKCIQCSLHLAIGGISKQQPKIALPVHAGEQCDSCLQIWNTVADSNSDITCLLLMSSNVGKHRSTG